MAETIDSIKQSPTQATTPEPEAVRDALLRLRELAAQLPPVDATALIREIREPAPPTR